MKRNIYLKINLHSLFPPVTESITQCVKRESIYLLEFLIQFFGKTLSDGLCYSTGSQ